MGVGSVQEAIADSATCRYREKQFPRGRLRLLLEMGALPTFAAVLVCMYVCMENHRFICWEDRLCVTARGGSVQEAIADGTHVMLQRSRVRAGEYGRLYERGHSQRSLAAVLVCMENHIRQNVVK